MQFIVILCVHSVNSSSPTYLPFNSSTKPACPQSQAGDAEGTEQSFIADPIPV